MSNNPYIEIENLPEHQVADWDDTKLRHAYMPSDHKVAICGYDGPCTWRGERITPANACIICLSLASRYWDWDGSAWQSKLPHEH